MGQKKDIGELVEKKLSKGKEKPHESVWERINSSLETERLRKKRVLYSWLVGTGLFSALLLFIALNNEGLLQSNFPKQQNDIPLTNHSSNSSEQSTEKTGEESYTNEVLKTAKEDTSIITREEEKRTSEFAVTNENLKLDEKEGVSSLKPKIKQYDSKKKVKNNRSTGDTFDEDYRVTKNYHYYNSKMKQTIVTQDKREIDSLISEQNKSLDSISTSKTDSLKP